MSAWTLFEHGWSAAFSDCGRYRYELQRRWQEGPIVRFVMLNPSTADAEINDPTVRRCIGYALDWGYAGLTVLNLYAYRATDPRDLWKQADPVGPDNDWYLEKDLTLAASTRAPVVAAWGAHAKPDRVEQVLALAGADRFTALGVTKDGAPRHPLYMPAGALRRPWPA